MTSPPATDRFGRSGYGLPAYNIPGSGKVGGSGAGWGSSVFDNSYGAGRSAREAYGGSGAPASYRCEDVVTDPLILEALRA